MTVTERQVQAIFPATGDASGPEHRDAHGEDDVSRVVLDPKSRDPIPQMLRGLQHLYRDASLRAKLFQLLESEIAPKIDKRIGRPGMRCGRSGCGVIRLDLNADYDRLHELVNQHITIRQMLGHGLFDPTSYHYQTLKDNVTLFTPELLDKINQIVVAAGHELVKKRKAKSCVGVATPSWLRPTCTTRPISACSLTPRASSSN